MRTLILLVCAVAVAAAQGTFNTRVPPPQGPADTMKFIGIEMAGGGAVVKSAPYSATVTTEFTQTLADGNRIHRTTTGAAYRDSEGRTRMEQTVVLGPLGEKGGSRQMVVIRDPVAGTMYTLYPEDKVVVKMPPPPAPPALGGGAMRQHAAGVPGGMVAHTQEFKTESLGTKAVEGVNAEGTRTTVTIPAGQVGNERAIEMVDERWYSPQLKVTVMSRHSDPRMGETVYRLTNINQAEPARALFEAPGDYTVKEAPAGRRMAPMRHE